MSGNGLRSVLALSVLVGAAAPLVWAETAGDVKNRVFQGVRLDPSQILPGSIISVSTSLSQLEIIDHSVPFDRVDVETHYQCGRVPPAGKASPPQAQAGPSATLPHVVKSIQGVLRGDLGNYYNLPNISGAVGPNHVVQIATGVFAVYDKLTGDTLIKASLAALFPGITGYPQVLFDQYSGRWFMAGGGQHPQMLLAVSLSDDPTGSWFQSGFEAGCTNKPLSLGVDEFGVYVGSFSCSSGLFAIDKAPLIDPSPNMGTVTAFLDEEALHFYEDVRQAVHMYGPAPGAYVLSQGLDTLGDFQLYRVDGPLSAPTLVDLGMVAVGYYEPSAGAPAKNAPEPVDTLDGEIANAVYRDGSIWTSHAIAGGAGTVVRWYEIDAETQTVVQSGTVSDPVRHYYMPSITVNAMGGVILGFSGSHGDEFVGAFYTGRLPNDPPGLMAEPAQYRAGGGTMWGPWGLYSLTSLDPVSEFSVWTMQEYAHSFASWGTQIAELRFDDCNNNSSFDAFDISGGTSIDADTNGVPDECQGTRVYVDASAGGGNYGVSWEDAYADILTAMQTATGPNPVTEIWVAAGTYTPDEGTGDRNRSFKLVDGLSLYGGFAGGETDLSQRDLTANLTILSGDLGGNDGTVGNSENAIHVVRGVGVGPTAILNGFVIEGGNANTGYPDFYGGGMYLSQASPTISDCTMRSNAATAGAGLYSLASAPTFSRCAFEGNAATAFVGGAYFQGGSAVMTDCKFVGNTSGGSAGGMAVVTNTDATLTNCLFSGNQAGASGGVLYLFQADQVVALNCTFGNNHANGEGGGIFSQQAASLAVTNTVGWGNSDGGGSGETAQIHLVSTPISLNYSCVQGLTGGLGGAGNIGADPLFVDADGADNILGTIDDDLQLSAGSPAIDAADNGAVPIGIMADLNGDARFHDDLCTVDSGAGAAPVVDMGAYEFQGTDAPGPGDFDLNCVLDLNDYAALFGCLNGPGSGPIAPLCQPGDLDSDDDVDLADAAIWLNLFE